MVVGIIYFVLVIISKDSFCLVFLYYSSSKDVKLVANINHKNIIHTTSIAYETKDSWFWLLILMIVVTCAIICYNKQENG